MPTSASDPTMIITPMKPASTPATRDDVRRSSSVQTCATKTVKSGVVALRIAASELAISVCPQVIKANGTALFISPMARNETQISKSDGRALPLTTR